MADLTTQQKKGYARTLYLKDNLTQQEIADKVGVSRNTINRCSSFLEERRNLKNCITGRNHIIDQDHIFALKVWTEEFVSCDWVTSIDSLGVIQTFVIHTHINTKDIGKYTWWTGWT